MQDYKHINAGTYKARQHVETAADILCHILGLFIAFGGLYIVLNLGA